MDAEPKGFYALMQQELEASKRRASIAVGLSVLATVCGCAGIAVAIFLPRSAKVSIAPVQKTAIYDDSRLIGRIEKIENDYVLLKGKGDNAIENIEAKKITVGRVVISEQGIFVHRDDGGAGWFVAEINGTLSQWMAGKNKETSILIDPDMPSISLFDNTGKERITLGASTLTDPAGNITETHPGRITFFRADGTVSYQIPSKGLDR